MPRAVLVLRLSVEPSNTADESHFEFYKVGCQHFVSRSHNIQMLLDDGNRITIPGGIFKFFRPPTHPKNFKWNCFKSWLRLHCDVLFISVILGKSHYVLFHLVSAMQPRMLVTFDEELRPLSVSVRVGQVRCTMKL